MQEKNFIERRKYVRLDLETEINFQIKPEKESSGQADAKSFSAITKNLSAEGICFTSQQRLEPGNILKLEVFLPAQSQPLRLEGRVAWIQPFKQEDRQMFNVGVKLFTIDRADENRFLGFICGKMTQQISQHLHL